MPKVTMEVEGLGKALKRVTSLVNSLEPSKVEGVLMKGAKTIAKEVRSRARRGPTGNLKKACKAKKGRRRGRLVTSALAAVDRKIAPHADLVERGTRHSAAKPYFRPGVEASYDQASGEVRDGLEKLLESGSR